MRRLLVLVVALAACGGGDNSGGGGAPPPPPPEAAKPAAKAKSALDNGRIHVEDRVDCAAPEKATGPACDPANPTCEDGLYCIAVGTGHNCEPCPERDSIRHEFRERDFVEDQARDPFRSPFQVTPGEHATGPKQELTPQCQRPDQLVATSWSYQDLHLVGIVAQGTQRKVLMMAGNVGKIIKKGDCVGKEKAYVKDIGPDYITFLVGGDADGKRPATERSVPLYPNGLDVEIPTDDGGPTTSVPVVTPTAPPGQPPSKP